MATLELKIPPVIILFLAIVGIYLSPIILPFVPVHYALPELRETLAWLILVVGVVIAATGVLTFKMAKTTTNPISIENASSLVTHGIYRFTRNPMYLGMLMILLFFILRTGYIGGLLFALGFICYITKFQIKPEERMLTKIFGKQHTEYMNSTRAWL